MHRWTLLFSGIVLGTLCACAPAQTGTKAAGSTATTVRETPRLTCAIVDNTAAMTLSYPTESIYSKGAVLPKQAGLACLENLADWLKSTPQRGWQIKVSGEEGFGFDPLALAGKRQELLQRFFERKGLQQQNWSWQTEAGQELQLQLVELKER